MRSLLTFLICLLAVSSMAQPGPALRATNGSAVALVVDSTGNVVQTNDARALSFFGPVGALQLQIAGGLWASNHAVVGIASNASGTNVLEVFQPNASNAPAFNVANNGNSYGTFVGNGNGVTNVPGAFLDVTKPPFNAVGNGVTDDSAAFAAALTASAVGHLPVYVPNRTFFLQPFTLNTNQTLFGNGGHLLFSSSSTTYAITINYLATNVGLYGLEIDGGVANSIPASDDGRIGVFYWNCQQPNWQVHDLYIHGFGTGIEVYGLGGNIAAFGRLVNCEMSYCYTGFKVDQQAEYMTFTGIKSQNNAYGLLDYGGNESFSACDFSWNNVNVYMASNYNNNAHCLFSSCTFNHANTLAVTATNTGLGAIFTGCAFLPPPMYLTNVQGFQFNSCMMGWISPYTITFDHSTNCAILFPQTPYYPPGLTAISVVRTACSNIIYSAVGLATDTNGSVTIVSNAVVLGTLQFPSGQYNAAGGSNALTATDGTNLVNALTSTGDTTQFTTTGSTFHISTGATQTNGVFNNSNGVAVAATGYISESGPPTNEPLTLVNVPGGHVITNASTGGANGQVLTYTNTGNGAFWSTPSAGGGGFPTNSSDPVTVGSLSNITGQFPIGPSNVVMGDTGQLSYPNNTTDSGVLSGNQDVVSNTTFSVIDGGSINVIEAGSYASISGGLQNIYNGGNYGSIGGGLNNTNVGTASFIAAGESCYAGGISDFVAGQTAQALFDHDFVWSGIGGVTFASTAASQVLFGPTVNVGINTNNPGSAMLSIAATSSNAPGLNIYGAFQENVAGQSNAIGIYNTNQGTARLTIDFAGDITTPNGNITCQFGNVGGSTMTFGASGSLGSELGSGGYPSGDRVLENAGPSAPLYLKSGGPVVALPTTFFAFSGTNASLNSNGVLNINGPLISTNGVNLLGTATNDTIQGNAGAYIRTNFISGQLYTNIYGAPILVSTKAILTVAGVSGDAAMSLEMAGNETNSSGISTAVGTVAGSYTNVLSGIVTNNGTYVFTNRSVGAGDSSAILGGQILIY